VVIRYLLGKNVLVYGIDGSGLAQQLARHASPTTTAGYDRQGERAKEQAASRLDVPYDGGRYRRTTSRAVGAIPLGRGSA
jgi:hypothetical protein